MTLSDKLEKIDQRFYFILITENKTENKTHKTDNTHKIDQKQK